MKKASKLVCTLSTLALASTLAVPVVAFADEDPCDIDSSKIPAAQEPQSTVATGAATRAAMPSLEILGINSVEESGQFITYGENSGRPLYLWAQPKYILAASGYNSVPSPYLANLATGKGDTTNTAVKNPSRNGGGAGPDSALSSSDSTDAAVLAFKPSVIVGNSGGSVLYQEAEGYSYEPGVKYSISNFSQLESSMGDIAALVETTAGKTGRYGSPIAIANKYTNYIENLTGYVEAALKNGTAKKTVILVNGVSGNEDTGYTYSLLSYDASGAGDGTASQNRYLETVQKVAYNYADVASATEIDSADLADCIDGGDIDLIMVGGQQGSSGTDTIVDALAEDGLLDSTYYVESNGSQGAMYGVVMNSVENAQNVGRILPCLYDDLFASAGVTQADFIAYYYKNFYHINEGDLATVMSGAMDGVRNWAATDISTRSAAAQWNFVEGKTFNTEAVGNIVNPTSTTE